MGTTGNENPFPTSFKVRVEKGWNVDGKEIRVGDQLLVEPCEEVKSGGLTYLRVRKACWIGWYLELEDGHKKFVPIDRLLPPGEEFPFTELLEIAKERGQDFILYPVTNVVRKRRNAANDRETKGGNE